MKKLIIFIHGIGSDKSTWHDMIKTLKEDNQSQVKEYKTHLEIEENTTYYFLYEYKSKISETPWDKIKELFGSNKAIGNITIQTHSKSFTTFLKDESKKFNEINIVAHSMGGLITLFSIFNLNKNNEYEKIKKIMFYGVPILGSEEPKKFKKYFKISSKILEELQCESPTIKLIEKNIDNKKIKNKYNILYIDGDADARIYKIEQSYIEEKIGNFKSIQGGHSEIIKPKDISDNCYIKLKEFIFVSNQELSKTKEINKQSKLLITGKNINANLANKSKPNIQQKQKKDFNYFFIDCKTKLQKANYIYTDENNRDIHGNYYCSNIMHKTKKVKINNEYECDNSSIRVFINLFKQCFNLHTSVNINNINRTNIKKPNDIKFEHLYQDNDISNLFIKDFYKYPSLRYYNYRINKFELIDKTDNIIDRIKNDTEQNGSTIFLTGFIGDGKSALLKKIESDFYNGDNYEVLYIDIEDFFSSDSSIETITNAIFVDFYKKLVSENIIDNQNYENLLKQYIQNYQDKKYILMVDSLDRIIYNDERYIFLEEYQNFKNKTDLIKGVVEKLIRFSNNLNASFLFALRPYIASTIFSKTQAINNNLRPNLCTLYEIEGNYSQETIKYRFDLLKYLLKHSELPETKEECIKYYISKFENILTYSNNDSNINLFKAFYNSSTHGYRTMVELYQEISEYPYLVNRFFKFDIILYYKLTFKKLYSQILPDNDGLICQERFDNHTGKNKFTYPNIFLIVADNHCNNKASCNMKKNEFTYWLKYLILLLLQNNKNAHILMSVQDIINIFNHNGYDDFIIKLVLGSLGTSNEYNCLKYDFKGMNDDIINNATVKIANLGSYLINDNHCFKFTDLQFIIDDWMLPDIKLNKEYFNEQQIEFLTDFMDKQVTYEYLSDETDAELHEFLPIKIKKVLFFLFILEISLKYEQHKYRNTFDRLQENLSDNLRDIFSKNFFRNRRKDVIREIKMITKSIPAEIQELINIEEVGNDFLKDIEELKIVSSLEKIFKDVYENDIQVECLEFM